MGFVLVWWQEGRARDADPFNKIHKKKKNLMRKRHAATVLKCGDFYMIHEHKKCGRHCIGFASLSTEIIFLNCYVIADILVILKKGNGDYGGS